MRLFAYLALMLTVAVRIAAIGLWRIRMSVDDRRYCSVFCQNTFFPNLDCMVEDDIGKVEYFVG